MANMNTAVLALARHCDRILALIETVKTECKVIGVETGDYTGLKSIQDGVKGVKATAGALLGFEANAATPTDDLPF